MRSAIAGLQNNQTDHEALARFHGLLTKGTYFNDKIEFIDDSFHCAHWS